MFKHISGPVQGKRLMSMIVQCDSAEPDNLCVAFHGATWGFRDGFDMAGVQSYRNEQDESYYRVMPNVNVAKDGDTIKHVLGEGVLKNLVVLVTLEGEIIKGSHVESFIKSLRDLPNLFF